MTSDENHSMSHNDAFLVLTITLQHRLNKALLKTVVCNLTEIIGNFLPRVRFGARYGCSILVHS